MRLVFDIETNGLMPEVDTIHCIVAQDVDTKEVFEFRPHETSEGLALLKSADELIGHNIISYDIPVIEHITGVSFDKAITDTLVMSRLIYSNIKDKDFELSRKGKLESKLIGSHALKAWGQRLKNNKGDFGETSDWSTFSEEMLSYCRQDVLLNTQLFELMDKKNYSPVSLELEHKFATICARQEHDGFPFDEQKAAVLYAVLSGRRDEIERELQDTFEPTVIEMKTKTKTIPFNPSSRQQIADRLIKRGWVPTVHTPTGEPKVDEKILEGIDMPEAKLISEYLMLIKRLGQLSEGKNAWLKLARGGKIHGRLNTNGAATGRTTASNPNLQQVPSTRAPWGKECRELFYAPAGWKLLGCDVSGLELRCLAHVMARYDGGSYAKVLLEGDIHTENARLAGLDRNQAKTMIYALNYGAGDAKLAAILGSEDAKDGKALRNKFMKRLPALKKLTDAVKSKAKEQGWIYGLDRRIIHVAAPFAALNYLLQGMGAVICKQWVVNFHELVREAGFVSGKDFIQVAYIHDELQILVRNENADAIGNICIDAIKKAGEDFSFRLPLTGEYGVGNTWADTH